MPDSGRRRVTTVGVFCDLHEENWPSMDLVADMLVAELSRHPHRVHAQAIRPVYARTPVRNAGRFLNRYVRYPRDAARTNNRFDIYHVVDHSYAHLVHRLPAHRTVVTCHDLDAFRCLLEPHLEPRPAWFRALSRHVMRGMQASAHVVCDSNTVREQLVSYGLVEPERCTVVPLGVHPSCTDRPDAAADAALDKLIGPRSSAPELLHVGSTAPRKRLDLLLHTFARVRQRVPNARLLRVGGALPRELRALAKHLGVASALVELPALTRPVLAALYRRATLVLLPSDREGFGLPMIEAMACGTPVLATDLPVLREVGGRAARFAAAGDADAWSTAVLDLLGESDDALARERLRAVVLNHAGPLTWDRFAESMIDVYQSILRGSPAPAFGGLS